MNFKLITVTIPPFSCAILYIKINDWDVIIIDTKTAERLVDQFERQKLIRLVCELVSRNEKAEEALLAFCRTNTRGDKQVCAAEKELQILWKRVHKIVSRANQYGGCSDRDEQIVFSRLDDISRLATTSKTSWRTRQKIVDEMMKEIEIGNSAFTDDLVATASDLCQQKEEKVYYIAELSKVGSSYYQQVALRMAEEEQDPIEAAEKKNSKTSPKKPGYLQSGQYYVKVAKLTRQSGEEKEALQIALKGLMKVKQGFSDLYDYLFSYYAEKKDEESLQKLYHIALMKKIDLGVISEKIYLYYQEQGNKLKQREMLQNLARYSADKNYWYKKCEQELTAEELSDLGESS